MVRRWELFVRNAVQGTIRVLFIQYVNGTEVPFLLIMTCQTVLTSSSLRFLLSMNFGVSDEFCVRQIVMGKMKKLWGLSSLTQLMMDIKFCCRSEVLLR